MISPNFILFFYIFVINVTMKTKIISNSDTKSFKIIQLASKHSSKK